VVPDSAHRGMWRVRWPDGRLSDMTNLTRAKDAVTCFVETEQRRQRGRHSPLGGRLCVKTEFLGERSPYVVVARETGSDNRSVHRPPEQFTGGKKRNDIH
jgi:hypothetical protein